MHYSVGFGIDVDFAWRIRFEAAWSHFLQIPARASCTVCIAAICIAGSYFLFILQYGPFSFLLFRTKHSTLPTSIERSLHFILLPQTGNRGGKVDILVDRLRDRLR